MFDPASLPKVIDISSKAYAEVQRRAEAAHVRPAALTYGLLIAYCVQHGRQKKVGALVLSADEHNPHILRMKHEGESKKEVKNARERGHNH